MNRKLILSMAGTIAIGLPGAHAQNTATTDSTKTLDEVTVTADTRIIDKNLVSFVPSAKAKKAASSGYDLLSRMSLPMIRIAMGSENVETMDGKSVALFIDSTKASVEEVRMMRPEDVVRVQYIDYPSDPRFYGARHVINFIMRRRNFGGYVKTIAKENFITNDGSMQTNVRINKGRMTFDFMGYGDYSNRTLSGEKTTETFNISGGNSLVRTSTTDKDKKSTWESQAAFRAKYTSASFTTNNTLCIGISNSSNKGSHGGVTYSDSRYPSSDFFSSSRNKAKFAGIDGSCFFHFSSKSSLNLTYHGKLSRTDMASSYDENKFADINNSADDDTQEANIRINSSHNLGRIGKFGLMGYWLYEHNRTSYGGTCETLNNATTSFGMLGASYSRAFGSYYLYGAFGWCWLATELDSKSAHSSFPYADLSIQRGFGNKHSISLDVHYSVWPPSSNQKSDNIIRVSPFMWHTGNPFLKSYHMLDAGLSYRFFPSSRYSFSLFSFTTQSGDQPRVVYEPYQEGVIRTLKQPDGSFSSYTFGINASTTQLDKKLYISCSASEMIVADKKALAHTRTAFSYSVQAYYYLGDFSFGAYYSSPRNTIDYRRTGAWSSNKDTYIFSAAWSAHGINLNISLHNIGRWNWKTGSSRLTSPIYSRNSITAGEQGHAAVKVSFVYTIGFGKKINDSNDINRQYGESSGILY